MRIDLDSDPDSKSANKNAQGSDPNHNIVKSIRVATPVSSNTTKYPPTWIDMKCQFLDVSVKRILEFLGGFQNGFLSGHRNQGGDPNPKGIQMN